MEKVKIKNTIYLIKLLVTTHNRCYGLCSPQNYVEVLIQTPENVILFGNGVFAGVNKLIEVILD